MDQSLNAAQAVNMVDIRNIFWILGLMASAGAGAITGILWVNKQISQTRTQLYGRINREADATDTKIESGKILMSMNKEKIGLLELSNKHQESRLDGLDEKIDNVQSEVTATKEKVVEMNLAMQTNQLSIIGEIRSMGDKFTSELDRMGRDIKVDKDTK
jgi:hypothetical protein